MCGGVKLPYKTEDTFLYTKLQMRKHRELRPGLGTAFGPEDQKLHKNAFELYPPYVWERGLLVIWQFL